MSRRTSRTRRAAARARRLVGSRVAATRRRTRWARASSGRSGVRAKHAIDSEYQSSASSPTPSSARPRASMPPAQSEPATIWVESRCNASLATSDLSRPDGGLDHLGECERRGERKVVGRVSGRRVCIVRTDRVRCSAARRPTRDLQRVSIALLDELGRRSAADASAGRPWYAASSSAPYGAIRIPVTSFAAFCSATNDVAPVEVAPRRRHDGVEVEREDERRQGAGRAGPRDLTGAQLGPAVDVPEREGGRRRASTGLEPVVGGNLFRAIQLDRPSQHRFGGGPALGDQRRQTVEEQVARPRIRVPAAPSAPRWRLPEDRRPVLRTGRRGPRPTTPGDRCRGRAAHRALRALSRPATAAPAPHVRASRPRSICPSSCSTRARCRVVDRGRGGLGQQSAGRVSAPACRWAWAAAKRPIGAPLAVRPSTPPHVGGTPPPRADPARV